MEFSKGEAGLGQHEINLRYADALEMADRHVIYKNGAKEIAGLHGRSLTFMAKYDMSQCGSSCHLHSSVWDAKGENALMYDENGPEHMSPVFRGWLGGQLAHAKELAWMYAPTVNSYKRYQPESWAPTAIAWGRDNRTCGFRVVGHSGSGYRVENRIPGADANPYLAFAASIAAGLDGIERGLDPGPVFEGNAYEAADLPRAVEHRRRDQRARGQRARQERIRRRRPPPPREHREAGVGRVRAGRDRLGAPPLLRAVLMRRRAARRAGGG